MNVDAVFGAPPAQLCSVPAGAQQFSPLVPGARSLDSLGENVASATVLAPPGTIEHRYTLAKFLRSLNGTLVALAPKDKGGSRLAKELREFGCEVEEDARQHHRICTVRAPSSFESVNAAISEGAARLDPSLALWTQPGVFSWNRVDPGTALLLENLPPFSGVGADLGCGIGLLSRKILKISGVRELHLLDLDGRAISCARLNLPDPRAHFHWADLRAFGGIPTGLDFVVTNPPFHDGGTEDQDLGKAFLTQASYLLRAGGVCWIVANRHLPDEELLRSVFHRVTVRAESSAFKIYEAHR
jgi:16S rRNA (guanine1207-N2)-methyltransferase